MKSEAGNKKRKLLWKRADEKKIENAAKKKTGVDTSCFH